MWNKITIGLLLVAELFLSMPSTAMPKKNDEVASLIQQRLSYMKSVSEYKAKNHLAIEDLSQEAKVLASSVCQAERLGLDSESVKSFVQAQMDAAKAIQYRYRADRLSSPKKYWRPEPLDQVRSKTSTLNITILTRISKKLTSGSQFTNKSAFMREFDQEYLQDSDKERLWNALRNITLKSAR